MNKASCGLSCFIKSRRSRKDFRFVASNVEEALQWVGGFADQQCFVNCLPHPLGSSKKQASQELLRTDMPPELIFRCKTPPRMLVILNPRSGRGRSSKVFHGIVEPIFKVRYTLSWIYMLHMLVFIFIMVEVYIFDDICKLDNYSDIYIMFSFLFFFDWIISDFDSNVSIIIVQNTCIIIE